MERLNSLKALLLNHTTENVKLLQQWQSYGP